MTAQEAIDTMLGIVNTWASDAGYPVGYEDVPNAQPLPPTSEQVWARAIVRHATSDAGSLTGAEGAIRYQTNGFVWVQIFAPKGDGGLAGRAAAQLLLSAFRAARMAVWFRNVRMNELGSDGAWTRYDVKADFEYDTVE